MKKVIFIIAFITIFLSTILPQAKTDSTAFLNPDGDVVSLTILQKFELPNEKAEQYNKSTAIIFEFLLKYPTTKQTTLLLYYQHGNNQIFAYDRDKYKTFNTNTLGVGATIYFK